MKGSQQSRTILTKYRRLAPQTNWAIYIDSKTGNECILNSEGDTIKEQHNNQLRYTRV